MQLFLEDGSFILSNEGIDCSLSLTASQNNPTAWYVDAPVIEPVRSNGWVGSVQEGGAVNFRTIAFNPHGHGTHTECLGHITPEVFSVNGVVKDVMCEAELITVIPETRLHSDGMIDTVITLDLVQQQLAGKKAIALVIRTLPNDLGKQNRQYSDTNPTYCDVSLIPLLEEMGVVHFLIDTPSVDREKDGGELRFHHAFWGVPNQQRYDRTITELIFIPDHAEDGRYLLNLQTAPFENDATPSRPVLFPIHRNAEAQ